MPDAVAHLLRTACLVIWHFGNGTLCNAMERASETRHVSQA